MKRIKKSKVEDTTFKAESIMAYEEYEPTVGSSTGLTSLVSHTQR